MLRAPWATSLRCHGAPGTPAATLRRVSCDPIAICFRGDLTALVLSMFKTWRRPWRSHCDLQRCHGALWDLTTTQRRSAAICLILQIAARSPSCVTGVLQGPRQYGRYFAKFYAYTDSDPTAMLCAPWAKSLWCHGALGMPAATPWHVSCNARATCFCGDPIALVLSDQRRSDRFCRSQRGRRPVWLGY